MHSVNARLMSQVGAASYVWLPLIRCPSGSFELLFLPKWSPRDVRGVACKTRGDVKPGRVVFAGLRSRVRGFFDGVLSCRSCYLDQVWQRHLLPW